MGKRNLFYPSLILFVLTILLNFCFAQSSYLLKTNRVSVGLDNNGTIADVYISYFPCLGCYDEKFFLYSAGFYMGGKVGDSIWVNAIATSDRNQDYLPGNVDSLSSNPSYKVYAVKKDPPFNQTWEDYRIAVEKGALFYNGDGDNSYNPIDLNGNGQWDLNEDGPDILGDITTWCVYNDSKPTNLRRFNDVNPLGIEVHQTIWSYETTNPADARSSTFFVRYKLINRGKVSQSLDSVYFGAWADTDLGFLNGAYLDDLGGSDTMNNATYIYNDADDPFWGVNPPTHFVKILQGPFVFIPGITFIDNNGNGEYDDLIDFPLDTAYNYMGHRIGREEIIGAKNLNMESSTFNTNFTSAFGIPNDKYQAWNYLRGKSRTGITYSACNNPLGIVQGGINCNLINPLYLFSGDPVINYGWINNFPQDYRQFAVTGPFKLKVGKPVSIIVAHIVGRGNNALNSITIGKAYCSAIQEFYKSNFVSIPLSVEENENQIVENFQLYQNYPNPFNPSTVISYQLPVNGKVSLRVYDILGKEIATLVDEYQSAGRYEIEFNVGQTISLSSGVYFYQLRAGDYVETKKMTLLK